MSHRIFTAIRVAPHASADVSAFLQPRMDTDDRLSWAAIDQLHLTLSFHEPVSDHLVEPLIEALRTPARSIAPFSIALDGAGCFPKPESARVLWLGVRTDRLVLDDLAARVRATANHAGVPVDGARFRPHVTVARMRRPIEATKWLRVLDTFASATWTATTIDIVASVLPGAGGRRPYHEILAHIPLSPNQPDDEPGSASSAELLR